VTHSAEERVFKFQMTEEEIYRLFETAYKSFDSEGNTPETE